MMSEEILNTILSNKYRLIKKLGRGSFSEVYLAENIENQENVAIKIYSNRICENSGAQCSNFMENERSILNSLSSKNIVKPIEAKILETHVTLKNQKSIKISYLVTEYCELGELTSYIKKGLPVKIARYFFKQLISAVDYLFNKGIAHRDIKTANIVLDKFLYLKLVDFGLSSEFNSASGEEILFKNLRGSKCYMAPEIHTGDYYRGDKADIFACGVVLFNMLTGRFPFTIAKESDSMYKHIVNKDFQKLLSVTKLNYLTSDIKLLLDSMLTTKPEERATIEAIKQSSFYKGEMPSFEELENFLGISTQCFKK